MATVTAFKGLTYNKEKTADFGDVCTPPYDVISKQEQEEFYKKHPHNIIRLILGKASDTDTDTDNPHTRAALYLNEWVSRNVLVQDEKPAIYFTSVKFENNDKQSVTRCGMIVRVRLESFDKGIILPHEKTFSKVKSERLNLMKQCHANFSPIFSLYSDPENSAINRLKENTQNRLPDMEFTDTKGLAHKMWRVTEKTVVEKVVSIMSDKILYIADGHHRYETALNYKNWAAENRADFSDQHPANFVMMYISSMDEPGLTIFPAHRLLTGTDPSLSAGFIKKAETYFDISRFPFDSDTQQTMLTEFLNKLEHNQPKQAIGVYIKNQPQFYLFIPKPAIMEASFSEKLPKSLRDLDVTVLTHLIFMKIMGFDQAMLDNKDIISYSSNAKDAILSVTNKEHEMAFILNPTKIEQVKQVAQEGLIMPRKTTYFYPKVITGQVIHKL